MRFRLLSPSRLWGCCAVAAVMLVCGLLAPGAVAGVANAGLPGAPRTDALAGLPGGIYTQDEVFPAYQAATGENKRLLGLEALRPHVRWFGYWYPNADAEATARQYIQSVTGGRSDVLAELAVFELDNWEEAACRSIPSPAEQASYKQWINAFAAGIGAARVALVLQPDLPLALCAPHHSKLPLQLVNYAARIFNALPHTTVYIDVGSADWPTVKQAVALLRGAGIRYARGFALDATHYDSTERQIMFGQKIIRALAAAHIRGRHFVINTAQNGRPFTYQQYHGPDFNNAAACTSRTQTRCVTLGIPPTTDVANRRWGLSARARAIGRRMVDAYLWVGRPWLDGQDEHFDLRRALALARTTPF